MLVKPLDVVVSKAELRKLYKRVRIVWPKDDRAGLAFCQDVKNLSDEPLLVITGHNPGGRKAIPWMNDIVDKVLEAALRGLGYEPVRVAAGTATVEDGREDHEESSWLVPYDKETAVRLLQTYGQAAAFVLRPKAVGGRFILWNDGDVS